MIRTKRSTTVTADVWRLNVLSEGGEATFLEVLRDGNVEASLNMRFGTMRPNPECAPFLDACLDEGSLADDEAELARTLRKASSRA